MIRVFERLRLSLTTLAGVAGFQALAARALTLAQSEKEGLAELRVLDDGSLEGAAVQKQASNGDAEEQEIIFISHLLGLLTTLVGETLTRGLVQDAWPHAPFHGTDLQEGRTE